MVWRARQTPSFHGMPLQDPQPVSSLSFSGADGRKVTIESLRGRMLVVYFGYTNCPDVCPTTLIDLSRALKALGPRAEQVRVAMITVDPERDPPDRMDNYAQAFNPAFIGLSGSPEQIADAASRFGVHYARSGDHPTGYAMEHTASVMVLDAEGRLRLVMPFGLSSAEMAEDLLALLGPFGP